MTCVSHLLQEVRVVQPQRAAAFRCCQHTAGAAVCKHFARVFSSCMLLPRCWPALEPPTGVCCGCARALHICLQLCTRLVRVTLSQQHHLQVLLPCSSRVCMCMCGSNLVDVPCAPCGAAACVCCLWGCWVRSCAHLHDEQHSPLGFCHSAQCPKRGVHSFGMRRCHSTNSGVNGRLCRFCSSTIHSGSQ